MLQIAPSARIFICKQFIDFRKGIDGLTAVCRSKLDQDPHSGAYFVFRNRTRNSIKILVIDGQGFWLRTKRLCQGKFHSLRDFKSNNPA